jgi:hypothetical protein
VQEGVYVSSVSQAHCIRSVQHLGVYYALLVQEERTCRFCKTQLGDWREEINALTNSMGQEATASSRYKPIMAVVSKRQNDAAARLTYVCVMGGGPNLARSAEVTQHAGAQLQIIAPNDVAQARLGCYGLSLSSCSRLECPFPHTRHAVKRYRLMHPRATRCPCCLGAKLSFVCLFVCRCSKERL